MIKRGAVIACVAAGILTTGARPVHLTTPQAAGRTMVGVWDMSFAPINGEVVSRKGNTLGFPEREMTFQRDGDFNLAFVTRGELGPNVKPLGVWRVQGDLFSATFQLWCPEVDNPCGSVIMRGRFLEDDRVRGVATVFWDEEDETRPTGFDTWPMSFRGQRREGGSN